WIAFGKRVGTRGDGRYARGERGYRAHRGLWQRQLLRQGFQPVSPLLAARFLQTAVAMQRNRAPTGRIRTIAALAMLDVELIIIETEPQRYGFPRQVWIDFIPHAGDADLGVPGAI